MGETKTAVLFEGLGGKQRYALETLPADIRGRLCTFVKQIGETQFLTPSSAPNKEWKLVHARTWNTAVSATNYTTRAASRDARPWALAYTAARGAALAAGRDAAWDAVGSIVVNTTSAANATKGMMTTGMALYAAMDASLYAKYLLVSDLDFPGKDKHWEHMQKCWEVWKKGYALLSDVNGELYVYVEKKPQVKSLARK